MSLILSGSDGLSDVDGTAAAPAIRGTDTNTGIFFPAADTIAFSEGGVEAVRIDASGNVGIGTSSPSYKLDVNASSFIAASVSTSYSGAGNIRIADASTTSASAPYIGSVGNNLTFGRLGTAEYARIDSGGSFFLNCTSSPTVNSTAVGGIGMKVGAGDAFNMKHESNGSNMFNLWQTGTSSFAAISFNKGNTQTNVGAINCTTTATSYVTSSDYRLKEQVQTMTGALAKVAALKPCTYKWKINGLNSQGFIAHELQAVVPECVVGAKDAVDADGNPQYQGIDTSFLVATLTAAIQEQQALITALTTRITALEGVA